MSASEDADRPSVTITRRLAWIDTDAAVRWHYTTLFRYAEEAEAELHRRLGISEVTFGATPRVRVEADFSRPAVFDERLEITLTVTDVGASSVTYAVTVAGSAGEVGSGRVVTVYAPDTADGAVPWPDDVRTALVGDGPD